MKTHVERARLGSAAVESIKGEDVTVTVRVDEARVESLRGSAKVRGRLTDGWLPLRFSPHLAIGVDRAPRGVTERSAAPDALRALGLSEEQIEQVRSLGEGRLLSEPAAPEPMNDDAGQGAAARRDLTMAPEPCELSPPLPEIPVEVDCAFEERDVAIRGLAFQETTTLEVSASGPGDLGIDDFEVRIGGAGELPCDSAEVQGLDLGAVELPSFGLTNAGVEVVIPRLSGAEVPIAARTGEGSADLDVKLIDWRPRWRSSVTVHAPFRDIVVWVEFGVDLSLGLRYRLHLAPLELGLALRGAVLQGVRTSLQIGRLALRSLKVGLLRVGRLLVSKG